MKETLKNFIAMVFATILWVLALLLLPGIYYLFESGPVVEEIIFLVVDILLLGGGALIASKHERLKTALEFPLIPPA
jgi:hypothetical protein